MNLNKSYLKWGFRSAAVVLVFIFSWVASDQAHASPLLAGITLNPSKGPPGINVTVHGSGWNSALVGHIYWNSQTGAELGTFQPNGNGEFSTTIVIPSNASPGGYAIWACQNPKGFKSKPICESASFKVMEALPTATPTATPTRWPSPTPEQTECAKTGVAGEEVITFEDSVVFPPDEDLSGQTKPPGVTFLNPNKVFVFSPAVETHSPGHALSMTYTQEFGSGDVPLRLQFTNFQNAVGVYVGVNQTIFSTGPITATLTAISYTCTTSDSGEEHCVAFTSAADSVVIGPGPTPIKECLYVEAERIFQVVIDYGVASEVEVIDDLTLRGPEQPVPVPLDGRPPIVDILEPAEGTISADMFNLSGIVREDVELDRTLDITINNMFYAHVNAAGVPTDYVFRLDRIPSSTLVPFSDNTITVTARDRAGNEGSDTVHIYYSPPPTPTRTPTRDIIADSIEITQVIQCVDNVNCADNSIPLFINKPTLIRVYVRVAGTGMIMDIPNISGELCVAADYSGPTWFSYCIPSENTITATPGDHPAWRARGDLSKSLNFYVPRAWLKYEGSWTAKVTVNKDMRDAGECCMENNVIYGNSWLRKGRQLNVVALRANRLGESIAHDEIMPGMIWLRYYPTSDIQLYWSSVDPIDAPLDFTTSFGWAGLLIRLDEVNFWTDDPGSHTRYFALVDPDVPLDIITGMAWDDDDNLFGAHAAAAVWLDRGGTGNGVGHELGHNHGIQHSPGGCRESNTNDDYPHYYSGNGATPYPRVSIGEWGVDMYTVPVTLYNPDTSNDIMSYCDNQWMSLFTYLRLTDAIDSYGYLPQRSAGLAMPNLRTNGEVLVGSGYVNERSIQIGTPAFYKTTLPKDASLTPDAGRYTVQLRDGAGRILYSQAFDPIASDYDPHPTEGGYFLVIPAREGTQEIVFLFQNTILGTVPVSANPPTVTLLEPNGGMAWPEKGAVTVRWKAGDADGTALSALVQYSPDGGKSWSVAGMGIKGTSIKLEAGNFPGGNQALIRVCVSDGANTACDTSDTPFFVPQKGPQVFITSPKEGMSFPKGEQVILEGVAIDREEGSIEDEQAYSWSSDRDGVLGTGRSLWGIPLSNGRHKITLTASDRDGHSDSSTVTIVIGPEAGAAPGKTIGGVSSSGWFFLLCVMPVLAAAGFLILFAGVRAIKKTRAQ